MPILNHTIVASGEPDHWLLLLHGIYGSGKNWGTFARQIVEECPNWGVILPDMRLHGDSTDFEPPHTVAAAAADVEALLDHLGVRAEVMVGHSYGGKVVLAYARDHLGDTRQVWVVDSTLEVGEPGGDAWEVYEAVRSLPDEFASRSALAEGLAQFGHGKFLSSWLGMNLERAGDVLRWKMDWEGVEEMLRDYFAADLWEVVESPPEELEVHVIRASKSTSLSDADAERIAAAGERTGRTFLHPVEGGHWINVDNPDAVLSLMVSRLRALEAEA